jgi:UPF0755 protein
VKGLIALGIILLCIVSVTVFIFNMSTTNIPFGGDEFRVVPGDSTISVARRLYTKGYIRSDIFFRIITRVLSLDDRLRTGYFVIEEGASTIKIIQSIYFGGFVTVSFTVPEGATLQKIKLILIEQEIVTAEELYAFFNQPDAQQRLGLGQYTSMEGFFFPETYKFVKGITTEQVFKEMIDLFFSKLDDIYPQWSTLSDNELYSKVIMASIIEREVRVKNEASVVAGVFYNRLDIAMKLQSCATVQYILGKSKEQLFESDLLIQHPYNTYLNRGLPPGAISNPGYNALKAAFYPEKHDYLFFVVKDPEVGSHHFSVTYQEHLRARDKYKQIKGFL